MTVSVRSGLASGFCLRALLMLARCGTVSPKAGKAAMEAAVILWWRKKVRRGAAVMRNLWSTSTDSQDRPMICRWCASSFCKMRGGWLIWFYACGKSTKTGGRVIGNKGKRISFIGTSSLNCIKVTWQLYTYPWSSVPVPFENWNKKETDSWHLYSLTIALDRWPWPKKEFKLVLSGQFCTLARFLLVVEGKRTVVGGWQAGRGKGIGGGGGARRQDCLTGILLNPDVAVLFSLNPITSLRCTEDQF